MKYLKLFLGALKKSIIPDIIFIFTTLLITEIIYQIRSLYKISFFSDIYNGIYDILSIIIKGIIIATEYILEVVFNLIKIYIKFISSEFNINPYIITFIFAACFTILFGVILYRYIKNTSNIRRK